jgi:hypothetical protein
VRSKKKVKRTVAKANRAILKTIRIAQRECVKGCGRGKAGDRYCTDCGTALPLATGSVTKSAPTPMAAPAFLAKSAPPTDPLWFGHRDDNDPDPAVREAAWRQTFAGFVGKSASQGTPAPNEPLLGDPNSADPAERERAWQQAYNHATKGAQS